MKTTVFKNAGALLITMLSPVVFAAPITVDFIVTDKGTDSVWATGSFTGEDNNITDGLLTFDELTSFGGSSNIADANLSTLTDTGDYDIVNNIWIPNGISWGFTVEDDGFFTWNGQTNSVNAYWTTVTTSSVSPVPIPAAAWLFGTALFGLAGVSRRKKA